MKTLKEYYNSLPERTSPKTEFVNAVAEKCEVSPQTVRFWIRGLFKPSRKEFYKALSQMTGIPEENLFS